MDPRIVAAALGGTAPQYAAQSKYLAHALQAMQQDGQLVRTPTELWTKLLAEGVTQYGKGKADQHAQAAQQAAWDKVAPLLGGYQAGPAPDVAAPPPPQAPGMENATGAIAQALGGNAPAPEKQPYVYQPPTKTGPVPVDDPRWAQAVMGLQQNGIDPSNLLEWAKAAQPDVRYDRGQGYNAKTGGQMGAYHPDLDKGQAPIMEAGQVAGVRNLPGAVNSAAETAGAVSGAQESAKAAYDLVAVPQPDGSTRLMPRLQAAQMLMGQGGGQAPAGFGVTQTPGERVAQEGAARTGVERQAAQPQQFAGLTDQARTTDLVIDTINKALPQIGGLTAGFAANLAGIKGLPAHDLQATLDTIKGNVGFEQLQKMRAQSPTGGALGAVSEQENRMLQSVLGSLDAGQSPDQLRNSLAQVRDQLVKLRDQRQQLYANTYGGQPGGGGQGAPAAPAPPRAQRQPNQVYQTPRGPMLWTGTGWLPQ